MSYTCYVVILESREKHKFRYETYAKSKEDAKSSALQEIIYMGWDHYIYEVISVEIED